MIIWVVLLHPYTHFNKVINTLIIIAGPTTIPFNETKPKKKIPMHTQYFLSHRTYLEKKAQDKMRIGQNTQPTPNQIAIQKMDKSIVFK